MLNLHPLNPLYPQPLADKARENGTAPKDPAAAPERPQQAAHGTAEAVPSTKVMVGGTVFPGTLRGSRLSQSKGTRMLFVKGIAASSAEGCRPFSLPHFIIEKEERACSSHPQAGREQQFPSEVLRRSQAVTRLPARHHPPLPPPPAPRAPQILYVENSGFGLLANAMRSSSFVSLLNNVIGYNWGNYGLLEEAKHRC